jgi:protein-disulfide isomerase
MSRKSWIIIAVVAVALLGGGAAWYFLDDDMDDATPAAAATTPKGGTTITDRDMTLGNRNAKVVLIEYAAPMCPHCAHFNEETFPQLKQTFIDTGKVFYVFRVMPIGPADGPAEKLARCQPRSKYFAFMDLLFRSQAKWDPEFGVTDVRGGLLAVSKGFGMSEDAFNKCVADPKSDDIINQVAEDGANRYGINSTPSIVIDGTLRPEMAEWSNLKAELDKELASK